MKLSTALTLIEDSKVTGFMVSFEKRENGMLCSDYFPDKHAEEELIENEQLAWSLAEDFSKVSPEKYVNIHVVNKSYEPISKRTLNKYP